MNAKISGKKTSWRYRISVESQSIYPKYLLITAVVFTNTHTFFDTSLSRRWPLIPLSLCVLDFVNLFQIIEYGKRKI